MKITLAETAGFCFGVKRAVDMVYELCDEGKKVCTLGPIIHNAQLVADLEQKGVRVVEDVNDVKDGEILVIRSHGVPEAVMTEAQKQGQQLHLCRIIIDDMSRLRQDLSLCILDHNPPRILLDLNAAVGTLITNRLASL